MTGTVLRKRLKRNDGGQVGDQLILTKPLGIGIHTTAGKQGKLSPEHTGIATAVMCQANDVGALLAQVEGVNALDRRDRFRTGRSSFRNVVMVQTSDAIIDIARGSRAARS